MTDFSEVVARSTRTLCFVPLCPHELQWSSDIIIVFLAESSIVTNPSNSTSPTRGAAITDYQYNGQNGLSVYISTKRLHWTAWKHSSINQSINQSINPLSIPLNRENTHTALHHRELHKRCKLWRCLVRCDGDAKAGRCSCLSFAQFRSLLSHQWCIALNIRPPEVAAWATTLATPQRVLGNGL